MPGFNSSTSSRAAAAQRQLGDSARRSAALRGHRLAPRRRPLAAPLLDRGDRRGDRLVGVISLVSSRIASSAMTSGAAARPVSRSSRARMSARTSAKWTSRPQPLAARRSGAGRGPRALAVTNSLASASGAITVPMSRPSRTAPPAWPAKRALALEQGLADQRIGRDARGDAADRLALQLGIGEVDLREVAGARARRTRFPDRRPAAAG